MNLNEHESIRSTRKQMNGMQWVGVVLGFIGLAICVYSMGWLAALGLFIMIWGNNVIQAASIAKGLMKITILIFERIDQLRNQELWTDRNVDVLRRASELLKQARGG